MGGSDTCLSICADCLYFSALNKLYNFTKKWGVDVAYIKIMESLFQSKATIENIMPLKYLFDTGLTNGRFDWKKDYTIRE